MWRSFKGNQGKIVGGLGGLMVALLLIFAWPLLLILFLVLLGVFLGGVFDKGRKLGIFLERLFSSEKSSRDDKID